MTNGLAFFDRQVLWEILGRSGSEKACQSKTENHRQAVKGLDRPNLS